jgi:hypothetical protein
MFFLCNFFTPKVVVVGIARERRKNMVTSAASQNVDPELIENGLMSQPTTE